jgi:hypothetical protein
MQPWTKQRLEEMIANGIEESLTIEYKGVNALAKDERKRIDITKDVSSFANSNGGILIYGMAEHTDPKYQHLPEKIDPISRKDFPKEWLEQVIQTIQPRIEGLVVHPVTIDEDQNTVCYVVEIRQSHTAHQARDLRYHRRHNFTTQAMEDYEVRDVMNRRKHPQIRASIYVNRKANPEQPRGLIIVKIENVGKILVRNAMVDLNIPTDFVVPFVPDGSSPMQNGEDGYFFPLRLKPRDSELPIFPGSHLILRWPATTDASQTAFLGGPPYHAVRRLTASVFADEMPAIQAELDTALVLLEHTPITPGTHES